MSKPTPGLRKRGKVWHIEKVIPGTGVTLCESTGETELDAAERYLAKRTREIRERIVYGERPARTFDQAAARYVEENADLATLGRYITSLQAAMPYLGELPLSAIHQASLARFIAARQQEGKAAGTITRDLAAIKRVLASAAGLWRDDQGRPWLDTLPTLRPLKGAKRKPRPITQQEQAGLFRLLPGYLAEMALFAVHTGLRAEEQCGLQWEWEFTVTGLDASVFVIPAHATKNGRERVVPLNAVARSIVDARRAQATGPHVFEYHGHRISRPTNKAWNKARAEAGLSAVRWHDLRHTFGMRLRAAHVGEEDRADLLGHHTGHITSHYSQAQISHLIACVEKLCGTEDEDKVEITLIKRVKR